MQLGDPSSGNFTPASRNAPQSNQSASSGLRTFVRSINDSAKQRDRSWGAKEPAPLRPGKHSFGHSQSKWGVVTSPHSGFRRPIRPAPRGGQTQSRISSQVLSSSCRTHKKGSYQRNRERTVSKHAHEKMTEVKVTVADLINGELLKPGTVVVLRTLEGVITDQGTIRAAGANGLGVVDYRTPTAWSRVVCKINSSGWRQVKLKDEKTSLYTLKQKYIQRKGGDTKEGMLMIHFLS